MRKRRVGSDGPEVSVVGLGCNNFGTRINYAKTKKVVDAALEAGVTLFDTADIYGQGKSESHLGKALASWREEVVVATKFGKPMDDGPDLPRGSRAYIRWACEQSLRRLGADHIDLYQMHEPDPATPIEVTLDALAELIDEGRVRFIGSSNFDVSQIEEADRVARERGVPRFVSAQNRYSLIRREPRELLPTCERLGIGMLPFFPLESGLLTGKYRRGRPAPEGTRLAGRDDVLTDEAFDKVERLERFAEERGVSLLEVAIGGLAALSAVASVIAGATKPEQVRANVAAGEWEPSAEDLEALTQVG
ncbi:MAG: aldo/keto reductase [Actinobacteria bacterium]|nr:MAG: aldo/keto reductase [Actinomycetota bacterium]